MPEYIYTCGKCKRQKTISKSMTAKLPKSIFCTVCESQMNRDIAAEGKGINTYNIRAVR